MGFLAGFLYMKGLYSRRIPRGVVRGPDLEGLGGLSKQSQYHGRSRLNGMLIGVMIPKSL